MQSQIMNASSPGSNVRYFNSDIINTIWTLFPVHSHCLPCHQLHPTRAPLPPQLWPPETLSMVGWHVNGGVMECVCQQQDRCINSRMGILTAGWGVLTVGLHLKYFIHVWYLHLKYLYMHNWLYNHKKPWLTSLHQFGPVILSFRNKADWSWSWLGAQRPNNWTRPDL